MAWVVKSDWSDEYLRRLEISFFGPEATWTKNRKKAIVFDRSRDAYMAAYLCIGNVVVQKHEDD